jgi:hypothetical protein
MISVEFNYFYVKCCYAECHRAEFCYAMFHIYLLLCEMLLC